MVLGLGRPGGRLTTVPEHSPQRLLCRVPPSPGWSGKARALVSTPTLPTSSPSTGASPAQPPGRGCSMRTVVCPVCVSPHTFPAPGPHAPALSRGKPPTEGEILPRPLSDLHRPERFRLWLCYSPGAPLPARVPPHGSRGQKWDPCGWPAGLRTKRGPLCSSSAWRSPRGQGQKDRECPTAHRPALLGSFAAWGHRTRPLRLHRQWGQQETRQRQ